MKRLVTGILLLSLAVIPCYVAAGQQHPRLYLDSKRLNLLTSKITADSEDYRKLRSYVDLVLQESPSALDDPYGAMVSAGALSVATGETRYRDGALVICDWVLAAHRLGGSWPTVSANPLVPAGDYQALFDFADNVYLFAVASDWLYGDLGAERLGQVQDFLREYCEAGLGDGDLTFDTGSVWSPGTMRWLPVVAATGLTMSPGSPWEGYVQKARDKIQVWTDQLCQRFADGGGDIEESGFGRLQVDVTRAAEMLYTADGTNTFRSCNPYFGKRIDHLLGQLSEWDRGQGLFPFRGGDFKDDSRTPGYAGFDELYEEVLLLMRWGGDADARRAAFAIQQFGMAPSSPGRQYVEFCFRDPAIEPEAAERMPLSHYAPGTGEFTARGSWTSASEPSVAFFCGDHRSNRMHLDQNSVQMSGYGGQLLVDSGNSDALTSTGVDGYSCRTVAHNTILIRDPSESMRDLKVVKAYPADGGQRGFSGGDGPDLRSMGGYRQNKELYDTGDILRVEEGGTYAYALGDATNAYNNNSYVAPPSSNRAKCALFQREFVFLRAPVAESATYMVLFDRVEVPVERREELDVASLFHFLNEPGLNGMPSRVAGSGSGGIWEYLGADLAQAVDSGAKLFLKSVLPVGAVITKIGGSGFEQYNEGKNYASESTYGDWRIEIKPPRHSSATCFLTVASPGDASRKRLVKTEQVKSEANQDTAGVFIRNIGMNWVLMFSTRTDGAPPALPIRYRYTPNAAQRNLVFDLTPGGTYNVDAIDVGDTKIVQITAGGSYKASQAGVLSFDLAKTGSGSDVTPPSGLVTVNGGGNYTASPAVLLMLTATDSQSGMFPGGSISLSNDNESWAGPFPYDLLARWLLSSGDGGKTVYVKFRDAAGNWSQPAADTIVLSTSGTPTDSVPPTGTLTIDGGATVTEDPNVDLAVSASDLESGIGPVSAMQFSNDGLTWSTSEPFYRVKPWSLSDGKGPKTVYARVTDQSGNWSVPFTASITYQ